MSKLVIVGILCIVTAVLAFTLTRSHWWLVARGAVVRSGGEQLSDATIFTSPDGRFLLLCLDHKQELYLIDLSAKTVLLPNHSGFVMLPGLVYSRNIPPIGASMGKAEVDPNSIISNEYIEFTSVSNARLAINLGR